MTPGWPPGDPAPGDPFVTQGHPWMTQDDPWVTQDDPWVIQYDPWVTMMTPGWLIDLLSNWYYLEEEL